MELVGILIFLALLFLCVRLEMICQEAGVATGFTGPARTLRSEIREAIGEALKDQYLELPRDWEKFAGPEDMAGFRRQVAETGCLASMLEELRSIHWLIEQSKSASGSTRA